MGVETERQGSQAIVQPTRPRLGADLAAVLAPWTAALGVAPVDPTKRESRWCPRSSRRPTSLSLRRRSTTSTRPRSDARLRPSPTRIRAGELLIQAKAALPHGAFGSWLSANVEFSDRTARGYMRLAGLDEAKRQRVADLSLRSALAAIADQRDRDRPVRSFTREEIEAMSGSERDALRRECLDTAARNMQDILALKIIPPPADIPVRTQVRGGLRGHVGRRLRRIPAWDSLPWG